MQIKLPFDANRPVAAEASIEIDQPLEQVFEFVGRGFFDNYPKWATDLVDFEPLDGKEVFVGAKAKQTRQDGGEEVESVFEIAEYQPLTKLAVQGLTQPYRQSYLLQTEGGHPPTRLTFRFEFLKLEIFMRPFEKLIRCAIEDGAENTVEQIKNLISFKSNTTAQI
ncbi:SRPBCC family protein [Methylomonas sp. SURF-1]|uniref:SRPBCC family protein n=1 Tax=Methylomonas aurea TaxID=2952224 RepID=A0ABT1UKR0_9GAMM|nr:SRPBCC family protein [Methylomonas sp. SURF-1]MCQ8182255.1 SRPBCC family protein [Methylomonas sp. SURF-1]